MIRLTSLALLLALSAPKLDGVALRWKPTDDLSETLNAASRAFKGRKVQVKPFIDGRADKQLIGQNTEENPPRTVTTTDDAGAWCATQVASLLRQAGVEVVDSAADLVVSGKVTRFMVDESNTYHGSVAIALTVTDAHGKEVWRGMINGESKRWGRSYKEENYMETLSDALLRAVNAFTSDPKVTF